jgi:hypothetical protein
MGAVHRRREREERRFRFGVSLWKGSEMNVSSEPRAS